MKTFPLLALMLSAGACFAASIHSDFEGGSTGRVEQLSDRHVRVGVEGESDQDKRNRQGTWYFFRVDEAPRAEITIDMVDLAGEYNYKPNRGAITKATPPLISYDRKTWTHITDLDYDPEEPKLRLRIVPRASRFWIAHTPPYTSEDLEALRVDVKRHPDAREQVIGKTVEGRDLYLWTISSASSPGVNKKTVWLMFRQHSWESGSSWVGEGLVRALLESGETARDLRNGIVWKIYPLCDPDGVARGGVRFNSNGYDLNRNWDVENRRLMPEIYAQRKAIAEWIGSGRTVDLFFTLHNTETSEYLEGPPDGASTPAVRNLAERFFAVLKERTTFDPTRPLFYSGETTTPGKKGRMTVIQGLYKDLRIPGFLMEQGVAQNDKLGGLPNIDDRLKFGRQLAGALAAAVLSDQKLAAAVFTDPK